MRRALVCAAVVLWGGGAFAETRVLRMAAIAPDGTAWARELKAYARDVEATTQGSLRMKWYLGGIAGDELKSVERARQGQLDGLAGAIFCHQLAPSLRVTRVIGLYRTRDESIYIHNRLKPLTDPEFRQNGFVGLGVGVFGADVLFSRTPVKSLAEWRRGKVWVWKLDPVTTTQVPLMGPSVVPTDVSEAAAALEGHAVDGMVALPAAALAFQWATQLRYFNDVPASYLTGCVAMTNATFDSLTIEQQQAVRVATAKFLQRFNDTSRQLDESLLRGLFERQGLRRVEAPSLRGEFDRAAQAVIAKLPPQIVSPDLVAKVNGWLQEHRSAQGRR